MTGTQGDISFAGNFVIRPMGYDGSVDIYFSMVPGVILRASATGVVKVMITSTTTPTGVIFQGDWEIHLFPDNAPYRGFWIEYDHVVELLVENGQRVEVGQPLARGSPASLRHGGVWGEKKVDEVEWGLRYPSGDGGGAVAPCHTPYLTNEDQSKILGVFETMRMLGWSASDSICLVDEIR